MGRSAVAPFCAPRLNGPSRSGFVRLEEYQGEVEQEFIDLSGARQCYEEGLAEDPALRGTMRIRFGSPSAYSTCALPEATILEAHGIDGVTQLCIATILTHTLSDATLSLSFEPARPPPAPELRVFETFWAKYVCRGWDCQDEPLRRVSIAIGQVRGVSEATWIEERIALRSVREGIAECWRSLAPDALGSMSFRLVFEQSGAPASAEAKSTLNPGLVECAREAVLGAHLRNVEQLTAFDLRVRLECLRERCSVPSEKGAPAGPRPGR